MPAGVADNPLSTPSVTAADNDLMGFALAAKRYLASVQPGPELAYSACLFRNEENWNSGSTYVVTMSPRGRVFFHANDGALSGRQLKPAVWGAIAAATGVAALPATGNFGRPDGGRLPQIGGYAVGYKRTISGNPLILVAGLDINESHLADEDVDPGDPEVRADEVVDRRTLKAFVKGAEQYVRGLYQQDRREAFTKAKSVLRDPDGPWRHGPIYLFIMEPSGYTIFHGAFPNRFEFQRPTDTLRDEVTGELILPQIIEVATSSPDGGFVSYYFDNPDDDSDSADVPKVTYARQHAFEATRPDGSTVRYPLIFGAGIYGDPVPAASASAAKGWLARFGRVVASQAVEMIGQRMAAPSSAASRVTLAGHDMHVEASSSSALAGSSLLAGPLAGAGAVAPVRWQEADPWPAEDGSLAGSRAVSLGEVLLNSAFRLALADGDGDGGRWTAWGRGGLAQFGSDEDVSLEGSVTTGMLGVDYEQGRTLTGLAVSHARGEGSFDLGDDRSEMEATLTTVLPHLRHAVSDELSVWGILGFGNGEMRLEETATAKTVDTGIAMRMGALGVRGALMSASEAGGLDLAVKSDLLLTQIDSEEKDGLEAIDASTRRLRALLEGSRERALEAGGSLRQSVEAGLRHDGGDAEQGLGVELGGRIVYAQPASGMTWEAGGRTLLAHQDGSAREWSLDGAVRLAPGAQGRGLSFTLSSVWGGVSSGMEQMWAQGAAADLAQGGDETSATFGAEVGYGLSVAGAELLTPYGGLAVSDGGAETWRVGGRLALGPSFGVSLEGDRRERRHAAPDHGLMLRGALRW